MKRVALQVQGRFLWLKHALYLLDISLCITYNAWMSKNVLHKTSDMTALEQLKSFVGEDLLQVNQLILDISKQSQVKLVTTMAEHLIASGGKRLRPMLTLIAAKICGYNQGNLHIKLAACVEFIHSATLMHDDVVDESALRRGAATANDIWGNKASVLVGDFLLSQAFQLMVETKSLEVLRILSETSAILAEGEVMQLVASNDLQTSLEHYTNIISAKTAKLFSATCEVGAVISNQPQLKQQALYDYGMYLGIAFQIMDDVLDYSAREEALGKTIGDDFRDGKVTLPVILAYEAGNAEEQSFWKRTIEDGAFEDGDLQKAIELIQTYDALKASMNIAEDYVSKAEKALEVFPDSEGKSILLDILRFSVSREI